MTSLKLIALLIVLALVVVFGAQNTQTVTIHFLMFKVPAAPMVLALSVAVLLGALLGWITSAPGRFRRMRQRRGLQSQVAAHEQAAVAAKETQPSQAS